jgi:three-Cys-motif partner protein
MPAAKPVEARHQTQHKLETMDRYWRTWGWILAHNSKLGFCSKSLWLVDTMAGAGRHESIGDKDGWIPGTPFQAVLAAKANQQAVPGVVFHVRAIDNNVRYAGELEALVARHRGAPPVGVDVVVYPVDWRSVVTSIGAEITKRCEGSALGSHQHRSLWLIDPFGVDPLDWRLIERLPPHSEVIVNFDENTARRFAGRAEAADLLRSSYRDDRWMAARGEATGAFAEVFMEQFTGWKHRHRYPLWPSGAQDRFLIHLTHAIQAVRPFADSVKNGLKAGTLIAGEALTMQQKRAVVPGLFERFHGLTLSINDMYSAGVGSSKQQVRTLVQAATDMEYAVFDAEAKTWTWPNDPPGDPTLGL